MPLWAWIWMEVSTLSVRKVPVPETLLHSTLACVNQLNRICLPSGVYPINQ